jgi:DNA-binding response OmpR family regulator
MPTLLVVDDNEMNRDMLGRRLERKGYRVLSACDGESALDLLATEPIDLVLLDIEMPGMSGLDVLREVRKTRTGLQLPILMATARTDSADVVRAL